LVKILDRLLRRNPHKRGGVGIRIHLLTKDIARRVILIRIGLTKRRVVLADQPTAWS
jgi:hypothetical protein